MQLAEGKVDLSAIPEVVTAKPAAAKTAAKKVKAEEVVIAE